MKIKGYTSRDEISLEPKALRLSLLFSSQQSVLATASCLPYLKRPTLRKLTSTSKRKTKTDTLGHLPQTAGPT